MSAHHSSHYFYHSSTDTYVRLISVNGIGEIRWPVHPLMANGADRAAAIHFGLIDAEDN